MSNRCPNCLCAALSVASAASDLISPVAALLWQAEARLLLCASAASACVATSMTLAGRRDRPRSPSGSTGGMRLRRKVSQKATCRACSAGGSPRLKRRTCRQLTLPMKWS